MRECSVKGDGCIKVRLLFKDCSCGHAVFERFVFGKRERRESGLGVNCILYALAHASFFDFGIC